jgi:TonB family protein
VQRLASLLAMLALPALSFAGWADSGGIPGMVRQAEGALWEDRLQVYREKPCAGTGAAVCVPYRMDVRNDSDQPIECGLYIGTTWGGDIVVAANGVNRSRETLLPAGAPQPAFSSKCKLIPSTLPPRPADACETEATVVYPEQSYPPGARRRLEGGETVLDIQLSDSNRIRGFRVVRSSGWQDLDTAAITVVKTMRFAPGCGGRTVRRGVLFEVWKEKVTETDAWKQKNCHAGCIPPLNDIAVTVTVVE